MKYIKEFNLSSEYDNWVNSDDFVTPNVAYVIETRGVQYNPSIEVPDVPEGYDELTTIDGDVLYDIDSKKLLGIK